MTMRLSSNASTPEEEASMSYGLGMLSARHLRNRNPSALTVPTRGERQRHHSSLSPKHLECSIISHIPVELNTSVLSCLSRRYHALVPFLTAGKRRPILPLAGVFRGFVKTTLVYASALTAFRSVRYVSFPGTLLPPTPSSSPPFPRPPHSRSSPSTQPSP
jgi:hypothetical protein